MKSRVPFRYGVLLAAVLLLCVCLLSGCGQTKAPAEETPEPEITPEPTPAPVWPEGLTVTELMPSNKSCICDTRQEFNDWIELANLGERAVELDGLFLSDDPFHLCKFALPARSLDSGERMLIFCGGEAPENAPFALDREGETLYFSAEDGTVLHTLSFGETEKNCSVCFTQEGSYTTAFASPGYPEDEEGCEAALSASDRHGALVINEIVSFNTDYNYHYGDTYDWLELKNVSDEEIDLGQYYVSDDENDRYACRLTDKTLKPGGILLVYCSGNPDLRSWGFCHVDFKLKSGDSVYLSREGEGLSDCVTVPRLPSGSYGRMEGRSGFFYFDRRTPDKENGEGFRRISAKPTGDLPQGVYEGAEGLTLSLSAPGTIYYTLDGNVPTTASAAYSEPIPIDATTVVRAVAYEEGKRVSDCASFSYIVNEGHTLPVVSVVCNRQDFNELCARVRSRDEERPAEAVMFDEKTGEEVFSSACGIKLHGASMRGQLKKSFKLKFRDRYGGNITADPFENGWDGEYSSLSLRAGTVSYLYVIKDELAALAAQAVTDEPLALDVRYCVLYINGSYHGIYALREAYSDQYAADHTASPIESVQVERNRSTVIMEELVNFARTHPLTVEENYRELSKRLDLESFATWIAIEAYFDNIDPGGNIRYIRSDGTGGKWRVALFDLDISLFNMTTAYDLYFQSAYEFTNMARELIKNPEFREIMLRCAAKLYHDGLGYETVSGILTELYEQLDGEMPRNCKRWNESYGVWQEGCRVLHLRLQDQRTYSWIKSLQRWTQATDEQIEAYFGDISVLQHD